MQTRVKDLDELLITETLLYTVFWTKIKKLSKSNGGLLLTATTQTRYLYTNVYSITPNSPKVDTNH